MGQSTGRQFWPFAAACLLFLVLLVAAVTSDLQVCAGHFGYPLDDTYIHMAMAKNFAFHGVWGITRYEFTSSTSSPLFTLLLAGCYWLTGIHELTPFVLNCLAALALLAWCSFVLAARGIGAPIRAAILCLLVLAIPLATLTLVSMEHVIHALLTLVFAHVCCTILTADDKPDGIRMAILFVLTPFLVTARYEAVFIIVIAGTLFLLRGMWKVTAGLFLASALPLLAYGWISMRHGWYPIPSSLLLKANLPSAQSTGMFGSFASTLMVNMTQGFHLLALAMLATFIFFWCYSRTRTIWSYSQLGLILFAISALLHLCLARVGWFFRYESYLVALGIVVCAIALREFEWQRWGSMTAVLSILSILFAIPIGYRFVHATYRARQAVSDIYCQQYQMGRFAKKYLADKTVVLADIGAVSFLSDVRVLDLIGLGSLDSLTARIHKQYSTAWLDEWSRRQGAVTAFTAISSPPPNWILITTWTIPGNYISGADHVGIYAVDPVFREELTDMTRRFASQIPPRVIQRPVSPSMVVPAF